jgi:hypothetical protein
MLLEGCVRGRWIVAPEDRNQAGAPVRSKDSRRTTAPPLAFGATRTVS